jgi:adenine-specific DNA-methyltransferase
MPKARATRRLPPAILRRPRELRHPLTPAEKRLWVSVRDHQLGVHIRRQHVLLGHFMADFYCAHARLCVEIDGDTHAEADQGEYDAVRTSPLGASGYRVLCLTNKEVMSNLPAVLEAIHDVCAPAPKDPDPRR